MFAEGSMSGAGGMTSPIPRPHARTKEQTSAPASCASVGPDRPERICQRGLAATRPRRLDAAAAHARRSAFARRAIGIGAVERPARHDDAVVPGSNYRPWFERVRHTFAALCTCVAAARARIHIQAPGRHRRRAHAEGCRLRAERKQQQTDHPSHARSLRQGERRRQRRDAATSLLPCRSRHPWASSMAKASRACRTCGQGMSPSGKCPPSTTLSTLLTSCSRARDCGVTPALRCAWIRVSR